MKKWRSGQGSCWGTGIEDENRRREEEGKHGMWTSMGVGVQLAWGAGQGGNQRCAMDN